MPGAGGARGARGARGGAVRAVLVTTSMRQRGGCNHVDGIDVVRCGGRRGAGEAGEAGAPDEVLAGRRVRRADSPVARPLPPEEPHPYDVEPVDPAGQHFALRDIPVSCGLLVCCETALEYALKARKGELFASVVDEGNVFGGRLDEDDIRGLLA